jgi:putative ATP-dependent endonuclease of OLD family
VIEQFEPENIVIIDRASDGQTVSGSPIDTDVTKPKAYRSERRQFADAILARAVLVVEGSTESAVFAAASSMLEQFLTPYAYWDLDMAGVSIFDAKGDKAVPKYGPMFKALKKVAFAFYDKQANPFPPEVKADLAKYDQSWESPYEGIEALLVAEMNGAQLKQFVKHVATLPSYPQGCGVLTEAMDEAAIRSLAQKVLIARKGNSYSYAAILIGTATSPAEIPTTIRKALEQINSLLGPKTATADPDPLEDILS